jgi:type II secretory pathway pseudopilin PulG
LYSRGAFLLKKNSDRLVKGITILEVVVILLILGIIAAVLVPQFKVMINQSREGRTKSNLGDLRGALAIYYSDNFGLFPSDAGTPETRLVSSLTPHYLKQIPNVDLPHLYPKKLNTVEDRFTGQGNWVYTTLGGFIAVNSDKLDTRGGYISKW